jgi:gliding motility associated protien GldN
MKSLIKLSLVFFFAYSFTGVNIMSAQLGGGTLTESGAYEDEFDFDFDDDGYKPLDDIVDRSIDLDRHILGYNKLREADIYWQRRVWRELDLREKQNLPFMYPEKPFVQLLVDGVLNGDLAGYSEERFLERQSPEDLEKILFKLDTTYVTNVETYEQELKVVQDDLDIMSVQKLRVKEIWYFDLRHSTMRNRILGIAPIKDVTDDFGNFLFEQPMFWIYYPDCREYLSKTRVFITGNDATQMSWADWIDMRFFTSYIYKATNVLDNRLKDYKSLEQDGIARLLRAREIDEEIFNWEQDLWAY